MERYAERLEPGEYRGFSASAKTYFDRQYKRHVCAVQFDVYDESLVNVLASLTLYLNLGSGQKTACEQAEQLLARVDKGEWRFAETRGSAIRSCI